MHNRPKLAAFALILLALLAGCQQRPELVLVSAQDDAPVLPALVSERTRAAANAVLASLSEEQRAQALRPIKDPLRKDWHFIPRERSGLMLGEMDTAQKTLVHKLLQTALSDSGYLKATDIIWLESVLYEMSNQNPGRDPGKYALLIFGDPADEKAAWGWRLEGHHLSINLTYTPEGIGVTPMFFGTNPAVVPVGPLAGKRVLSDAHDLAVQLAKSMSEEQLKQMMLADKPRDVISGPGREGALGEPAGIATSDFVLIEQEEMFYRLVLSHLESMSSDHYSVVVDKWFGFNEEKDGPEFYISWAGPIDPDQPFYYRIHSPKFVIEYSCQGKNHVHAVMHDLSDPLQEDLLKKHFEQHQHGDE